MKITNLLSLLVLALGLLVVSCASEGKADAADDSAAITETTEETAPDAPEVKPVAQQTEPVGPLTAVSFEETDYDFGKITDGDKVQHVFKFVNTGKEPLVISNAKGSCGCTVPSWPKEPIAPGEEGEISVEFNSKKKPGMQTKRVTITANTDPPQTYLNIKADVQPNPDDAAAQ